MRPVDLPVPTFDASTFAPWKESASGRHDRAEVHVSCLPDTWCRRAWSDDPGVGFNIVGKHGDIKFFLLVTETWNGDKSTGTWRLRSEDGFEVTVINDEYVSHPW